MTVYIIHCKWFRTFSWFTFFKVRQSLRIFTTKYHSKYSACMDWVEQVLPSPNRIGILFNEKKVLLHYFCCLELPLVDSSVVRHTIKILGTPAHAKYAQDLLLLGFWNIFQILAAISCSTSNKLHFSCY